MKRIRNLIILLILSTNSESAEINFQFKDPAFNGINWAGHVLTINQQEQNAKNTIESKKQAEIDKQKAEAANTPIARFMNLFQSQVYAQLATQLSNNLFGEGSSNQGTFTLDGSTISYIKTDAEVQMTVVDSAGHITKINVPISQFKF